MDEGFARYLNTLAQTEWLPPAQLAHYQTGLIKGLVAHAHAHVPFYRERLAGLITPGGDVDLGRWHKVPIVSRTDAVQHAAAMRSRQLPDACGRVHELHTSGSTGTPLHMVSNRLSSIATNAALTRLARWWDVDTSRPLAKIRIMQHGNPAPYPDGRDWKGWSRADPGAEVHELELSTPVAQQLEWLLRKGAPYLMTSPSNAMALAYAAAPAQASALAIKLVFAIAETVLPRQREIVAERLGAPMAAIYSCEEIGFVATQCPTAPGYHVVAENAVVEILRDDGTAAEPGEAGQIVVTGLYNYAMPFIRYAIGDVGIAGPVACSCGRSLPIIAQVVGRTRHAFVFKDGTRTWPRLWDLHVADYVDFRAFQMALVDRETVEFRYVPGDTGRQPDHAGLARYLRGKLHPSVATVLVPMAAIPPGTGGKIDHFISLVAD